MARIRSVHPSLFTCDEWVSCSHLARILYIGLWTDADDQGVFEWKPLQIKMRLLPGDSTDAKELLSELEGVDLIRRFDGPDGAYGAIKDFRKFQRPQKPNAVHDLPDNLRSYVRIDGGDDDPTTGIRKELCEEQGRACYYCSTEITHYSKRINSCEIDHKVPKSKGGTDERSNLVASCRSCNRGKCDKSEAEWFAILESRVRKSIEKSASTIVAPQMEDGGCRGGDKIVIAVADASASDWPDLKVRGWMNDLAAEIGSGFLDPSKDAGLIQTHGVFLQWQRLGLSWNGDVIPIIAGSMAKQRGPVKSWKYFDAAMRERAEEIKNPKPVGGMNGKRNYTTASERREAYYAEIFGTDLAGTDNGTVIDG